MSGLTTGAHASPHHKRPVTSKPRGICAYYTTPRGCYAGDQCKFLHGPSEYLTPYDKNKVCNYYAAGYCKRGDACWFVHIEPCGAPSTSHCEPLAQTDEEILCAICYDKPVTFGLLGGCSHAFCLSCIRNWRDPEGKSLDMVEAQTNKTCPMCRTPSRFVTPSSHFYADGDPLKEKTIEKYKESMARVSCRYFQRSHPNKRHCPFGDECFYKHENIDGTPYVFNFDAEHMMERRRVRREFDDLGLSALLNSIGRVFQDTPDMQRAVFASFATAIFGNNDLLPMFPFDDEPTEAGTVPLFPDLPPDDTGTPGPSRDSRVVAQVLMDDNSQPEEDVTSESTLRPATSPPVGASTSSSSVLDPTTPAYVPWHLQVDSMRPLPPSSTEPGPFSIRQETLDPGAPRRASAPPYPTVTLYTLPDPPVPPSQAMIHEETSGHECDPPFMTDGRGRVVWSRSTSPTRGREGRRGRAASSSATVIPKPSPDIAVDEHVNEYQAEPYRLGVTRLVRQRSLPSVGSVVDGSRSNELDGYGMISESSQVP